ncbi:MAG TPA: hypothetical protein VGY76_03275 [Solirubrobacteraceae bacterium]|nr:hypothetical protein [Solirubrobacteraceae bacterium]
MLVFGVELLQVAWRVDAGEHTEGVLEATLAAMDAQPLWRMSSACSASSPPRRGSCGVSARRWPACGWCWWWVAWACESQGGGWYCLAFLVFGTLAWGGGTWWWAHRRGYWPSAFSARLFEHVLGERAILPHRDAPAVLVLPRRC